MPRSMFLRSGNLMVANGAICFDLFDIDLCKITFWAISQLLMGKTWPNLPQGSLGKGTYMF